ncbi:ABC transporter ATP-binding protein [Veillonella montpellierensis DNF00314]|uniref:ABC transporter ATP-binding protein n=1 Tax=Veillonella montpellierensis DNF00314 TaxID=1401067 RepID=A0A096CP99_9FIRM|nr:ABC transporter ATP-binding protein [Veillonella montpellierensis]KGF47154.1 ABC transporter ATP-binding protein [Veillonella montpellierensis DNF00314]
MNNYKRLVVFVKPYRWRMVFAVFCMIVAAAAYLVVPWLIKNVVDEVLQAKAMWMLNLIVGAILIVFLLRGFATYGQTYNMSYIGQRVIIDIREALFKHLQRMSLSYFDRRKTGVIMSNLTNDVGALQSAIVENLVSMVTESVTLIGSFVSMLLIDWKLTLVTLITVPMVLGIINIFGKRLRLAGHDVQGRTADITSLLQETLSGIRVVKSFAHEDHEIKRFTTENENNFRAVMRATKLTSLLSPLVEFSAAIAITVILWYGGYSVVTGSITAGSLIAFLIYAINLSNPVKRLSQVYGNIQKAMAAGDRVLETLDTPEDVVEKENAIVMPPIQGHVVFDHVDFTYDGEKMALQDFCLDVEPGEVTAIVGPSGAGKTTLANLLPRFYDVANGRVCIDGIDVRDVTFTSLREQIGLVPQDTMLFNTTIWENILYGNLAATDEEIVEAAKAANVMEFAQKLPNGLDTIVGERGNSLSGGQRQRVAIARAILKNPKILILDEATSALDTESERLVQEALDRLMRGRTAFVIAHRLSTIQNADRIIVLQQGKLVEQGTHEELLALPNGVYQYLHSVQFADKGL